MTNRWVALVAALCCAWPVLGADPEQSAFAVGASREVVLEAAFESGGARLYRDQLGVDLFGVTFQPFGMHLVRETLELDGDTVVKRLETYGPWVGREPLTKEEPSGDEIVLEKLEALVEHHGAQLVGREGADSIYTFSTESTRGEIGIRREPDVRGYLLEAANGYPLEVKPIVHERMWFGLGGVGADGEIKRVEETTTIPHRPGTSFLWEVVTDPESAHDYRVRMRFPAGSKPAELPEGVELDPESNEMTMPIGRSIGRVVLDFKVEKGDPPGSYRLTLLDETGVVAAVEYSLEE